jgi:thiosulfate/3-mercaptopyruvate sulfurtransferase
VTGPLYIDVRPAEQFAVSRIPGAVHLDLWGVSLIDTSEAPLRAFMWMIDHLFALRGVSPDRPVVVYESTSGVRAARALWFLDYFGHPDATMLDGGFDAWQREGRPVETGEPAVPVPSSWEPGFDASTLATWQDVRARLGKPETAIVDTRSEAEYGELVRAKRGGSIGRGAPRMKQNLTPTATSSHRLNCAPSTVAGRDARPGSSLLPGRLPRRPHLRRPQTGGI